MLSKLALSLFSALLALSCGSTTVDPTGGETHFLTCEVDQDCRALSPSLHCEQGVCQPPAESEGASSAPLVVGDSFFASEHRLAPALEVIAQQSYRDHSSLFDNTLALYGRGIAEQYAAGKTAQPVKVVIMAGGGADALLGSCQAELATCPLLQSAAAAARELLAQMAADGVGRVVYVYYPDPSEPALRAKIAALRPLLERVCADATVPCRWVDLRSSFEGRATEYLAPDGMNPSALGAEVSALEIWKALTQ